ncbi:hypothetical protein MMC30_004581 [Trapelia coarctata]|nr:hypothetical protein [Trapelia coarctata]
MPYSQLAVVLLDLRMHAAIAAGAGRNGPYHYYRTPKSPHSRAARRASSPSINLDKSLKNIVAPTVNKPSYPSVLAVHSGAGITKRKASKNLKRQQRLRHEKGMERAETVMDKVATKVEKGKAKERVGKERGADWDEHNRRLPRKKRELVSKVDVDEEEMKTDEEGGWEDMPTEGLSNDNEEDGPSNERGEEAMDEVL